MKKWIVVLVLIVFLCNLTNAACERSAYDVLAANHVQKQATTKNEMSVNETNDVLTEDDWMTERRKAVDYCMECLGNFLFYWNQDSIDEMLQYCSRSWKADQDNQEIQLFALMANRIPVGYTLNSIKVQEKDAFVDIDLLVDRRNRKPLERYKFMIHLVKEYGEWYIDPKSISKYEFVD